MTKDIDLDWYESSDELLDTLLDAADHDVGDFFTFRIERAGPPLAFAGVAPVTVPAIPLETQVAEKLHAYTRTYHDAQPSSRSKDLVDLVLIAELASLDAVALRHAIETTFAVRGTNPVPETLPAPPPEWRTSFGTLARTVGIPTDLASAHATAADLLDPILSEQLLNGTWNTEKRQWI